MDFFSLFLLNLIFFGPLIIIILYFIKIIIKFPSIFLVQLFIADIFALLWVLAGIPVLVTQDFFSLTELIIIEELGVIFGTLGFIFLFFTFNQSHFGIKRSIFARIGAIAFALLAGIKLSLLLINNPNSSVYGLYIENGILKRYTAPFVSILVLIAFSLLILVLFLYTFWQKNYPDFIISQDIKRKSLYSSWLMLAGVSLNYLGLILPIHLLGISNALFFISRFFISFSYIFITLMIAQNPIITLHEKANPKYLIEKGIIGWVLSTNSESGPETVLKSDIMVKVYNLTDKEFALFAVSSIAIIGIGQNFIENQFIIPFPIREKELSVICYSFTMHDSTLIDKRRNKTANIVFGIVIPRQFLNFLGNIFSESFSLNKSIRSYNDFNQLKTKVNFFEETNKTLSNLLLQKIS